MNSSQEHRERVRISGPVALELGKSVEGIFAEQDGLPVFKFFSAGEWREGDRIRDVKSPIDNSVIARLFVPGASDVEEALETLYKKGRWAARNLPGERRISILYRLAGLLEEHADELAEMLVVNAGKPRKAAYGEVHASIDRLRKTPLDLRKIVGDYIPGDWDEHTLETEGLVRREPYGVVLSIVPFNYPLFDTVNKFAYSFLPGNAVAIKPPSSDPLPIFAFVKLALEAGVPGDSLALLPLPGRETERMVSDPRVSVISLTGSTSTGEKVLRAAGIKQFVMELGGGDPAIVLSDADLDQAAEKVAQGITAYSGQRCDAIKLVLVERPVYEEFKQKLVEKLSQVRVGDPREEGVSMGPVIDRETADLVVRAAVEAREKGGKILYGGEKLGENYIMPTLVEVLDKNVLRQLEVYREEIFAAIAVITPVDSLDEAIELANGRRYGLDAAVFGKDVNKIRKAIRLLEVGAVYVNDLPRHGVGYYPFGGRKASGLNVEGIGYSIEYVTAYKSIVFNYKGARVWSYL